MKNRLCHWDSTPCTGGNEHHAHCGCDKSAVKLAKGYLSKDTPPRVIYFEPNRAKKLTESGAVA